MRRLADLIMFSGVGYTTIYICIHQTARTDQKHGGLLLCTMSQGRRFVIQRFNHLTETVDQARAEDLVGLLVNGDNVNGQLKTRRSAKRLIGYVESSFCLSISP